MTFRLDVPDKPELYKAPKWPRYGWRWHVSRTGRSLARVENYASTARIAETLAETWPTTAGGGQISVVVDGEDSAEFARAIGRGCRRRGHFVVHTSPRHSRIARAQSEVLRALGKDWDWAAQGGTASLALLARVWLRAERARDLVVLRAEQVHGVALAWLLATAAEEHLRLWLLSTQPLPHVHKAAATTAATVDQSDPAEALAALEEATNGRDTSACRCEDLSHPAPDTDPAATTSTTTATTELAGGQITVATTRRIRLLYDIEAAALATATALLGCPQPDTLATHHARGGLVVADDGASMTVAGDSSVAIPEHAQALLRGWTGRPLLPSAWAHDVVSTYLTLRLEDAERHSRLRLLPPEVPDRLPYVPWHTRYDPGAQEMAELTRSRQKPPERQPPPDPVLTFPCGDH